MEPGVCHTPFLEFYSRQPDWDRNLLQDSNDALEPTSNARLTQRAWTMGLEESSQRFFSWWEVESLKLKIEITEEKTRWSLIPLLPQPPALPSDYHPRAKEKEDLLLIFNCILLSVM